MKNQIELNPGDRVAVKTFVNDPHQTPRLFVNGALRCALSPEGVAKIQRIIEKGAKL